MKLIFVSIILSLSFISCKDDSNPVEVPKEIPLETLHAAPETLSVAGQNIYLSTYMWRDFMPISPPDGKPLIAVVYIGTTDSTDISTEIDADVIYVIKGNEIWRAYLHKEEFPSYQNPPRGLIKVARDGPKWQTQILVDVVVNVNYRNNNYLLKAKDQFISETW